VQTALDQPPPEFDHVSIRDFIWKRDTPAKKRIFSFLKSASRRGVPVVPVLHHGLLAERRFRKGFFRVLLGKFYYEPLFKLVCTKVGSGLLLYENMPKVLGDIQIELGDDVTLSGDQVWMAGGPASTRQLSIGQRSYIGHAVQIICGSQINIGSHVLIANRVILNGYDGHPLDPFARARNEPGDSGPISVGDYAWIGNDAMILKNVRIGRGAVVASGAIVTEDVADLTVVAGVPARPIKKIDPPAGW
jgi:acetyltransferase-like isoleucine patch superfamily enzyme